MSFHYIYMDSDTGIQPTVSQGQTPLWLLRENKRGSVKSGDVKLKKKKHLEGRGGEGRSVNGGEEGIEEMS